MAVKNFHHPFQPYDIQQELMQAIYDCIEEGKVGIFESPTGTGKSLSLICGSLTWLREHKRKLFDGSVQDADANDEEPVWLVEHAKSVRYEEALAQRTEAKARLEKMRMKEANLRKLSSEPARKRTKVQEEDEEDFALDDYYSDEEPQAYSAATTRMLNKLGMIQQEDETGLQEEQIKVYFCSRTHSQLSQLIGELRRVHLPSVLPSDDDEPLKQIALGSRKNLCINAKVNKLNSQTAINERCLELQQASTKIDNKCPYLPRQDQAGLLLDFRDMALSRIRDIEDLAAVGKRMEVCPYYASRGAVVPAEVVALPYPLLLQKASRDALGISLKGSVVIIDEAHNLTNAVESAYSTQISDVQLQSARTNLMAYLQKYRNRLAGSNRVYVAQLVRLIDSLIKATISLQGTNGTLQPSTLLCGKGVDQINLPKLVRYIEESKIARKVESYTSKQLMKETPETPTLTILANFMLSLINPTAEGNFFWSREADQVQLKYLLLDPSQHFKAVIEESRAVILAGGTMSPMEDHIQQLFPQLADQVRTLSCGHIVPTSSLLVETVVADTVGTLEFNYKTRSNIELIARVGRLVQGILHRIKGGMVVFFASYSYLEAVRKEWSRLKFFTDPIFYDSQEHSAEATFEAYSASVRDKSKTMLCSVIGGKLSEGINFSDALGRCVVVVGLPYPNLETPEFKAKIQYLEQRAEQTGSKDNNLSRNFAENICMRAVNQAIGRAIRHKNDWASIILIDSRYGQTRIRDKLPSWIQSSIPKTTQLDKVADLYRHLDTFFREHS